MSISPKTTNTWYPDSDFVEMITTELTTTLFSSEDDKADDTSFQYLGGNQGKGQLQSALARPKPVFGIDRYQSLADKAATLIWGIIKNHPFNDGNKRGALITGLSFLMMNKHVAIAESQFEFVQLALDIADNNTESTEESISTWIEKRMIPSNKPDDIKEIAEKITRLYGDALIALART